MSAQGRLTGEGAAAQRQPAGAQASHAGAAWSTGTWQPLQAAQVVAPRLSLRNVDMLVQQASGQWVTLARNDDVRGLAPEALTLKVAKATLPGDSPPRKAHQGVRPRVSATMAEVVAVRLAAAQGLLGPAGDGHQRLLLWLQRHNLLVVLKAPNPQLLLQRAAILTRAPGHEVLMLQFARAYIECDVHATCIDVPDLVRRAVGAARNGLGQWLHCLGGGDGATFLARHSERMALHDEVGCAMGAVSGIRVLRFRLPCSRRIACRKLQSPMTAPIALHDGRILFTPARCLPLAIAQFQWRAPAPAQHGAGARRHERATLPQCGVWKGVYRLPLPPGLPDMRVFPSLELGLLVPPPHSHPSPFLHPDPHPHPAPASAPASASAPRPHAHPHAEDEDKDDDESKEAVYDTDDDGGEAGMEEPGGGAACGGSPLTSPHLAARVMEMNLRLGSDQDIIYIHLGSGFGGARVLGCKSTRHRNERNELWRQVPWPEARTKAKPRARGAAPSEPFAKLLEASVDDLLQEVRSRSAAVAARAGGMETAMREADEHVGAAPVCCGILALLVALALLSGVVGMGW